MSKNEISRLAHKVQIDYRNGKSNEGYFVNKAEGGGWMSRERETRDKKE